MVGVKVFVGNLSFKTTEAELAEAFKGAAKIVNAHIITTPSGRSKGYGFVEFETKAEAEKAAAALNKKEIGGRPINVELARPQEETATTTANTTTTTTTNNNAPRQPRAPRARREGGGEPRSTTTTGTGKTGGRFPKKGGVRTTNNNNTGSGKAEVADTDDDQRRVVRRRPRRYQERRTTEEEKPEDKAPSKTMLFVANLAWKVTDESFNEFLKKEGIKFKSANVVITRNGRSRGYGFISYDTTDEQNRAMEILNKSELDGRPLNVKVANASSETPRSPAPATGNNNATTTATTSTTTPAQPAPDTKN